MARIQPGLERIAALVQDLTFPWKSIHVAGTNGKGSVCHYASSMLVGRGIKVGKFTSPHLVDRWDGISIDNKPIPESTFRVIERHLLNLNNKLEIGASPFEILTAAAFTCFRDEGIEVGLVEVGMGGTLDCTNILQNQAVSVITKVAHDHQNFLGNTLSEIAAHKAGILRPSVPYIVDNANEANVKAVIDEHATSIGAGPLMTYDTFKLQKRLYHSAKWLRLTQSFAPFQMDNLKLAVVAVTEALDSVYDNTKPIELAKTLLANAKTRHPGRQEIIHATPVFKSASLTKHHVLVDGAHNPDAAKALSDVVHNKFRFGQTPTEERPAAGWPVTWVLAMTEGKDAREYLAALLQPGDKVVTTTFGPVDGMPWVKPMDPKHLLEIAKSVQPDITGVHVPVMGALRALSTAKYLSNQLAPWAPIALTGSLYLVGDLHRELQPRAAKTWWTDTSEAAEADRETYSAIQAEERERVDAFLNPNPAGASNALEGSVAEAQTKLQEELEALDREIQRVKLEEDRLLSQTSTGDETAPSALERLELEDRRFALRHSTPEQITAALRRAEKAKVALAIHQLSTQIKLKEYEDQREVREAHKLRLLQRRERRQENKKLREEKKRLLEEARKPYRERALGRRPEEKDLPNPLFWKQKKDEEDAALRDTEDKSAQVLLFRRVEGKDHEAARRRTAERVLKKQQALQALSNGPQDQNTCPENFRPTAPSPRSKEGAAEARRFNKEQALLKPKLTRRAQRERQSAEAKARTAARQPKKERVKERSAAGRLEKE